jgi:hypothetical protein
MDWYDAPLRKPCYGLAMVAARVSGETGITPIGAIGKITQLSFGAPGNILSLSFRAARLPPNSR